MFILFSCLLFSPLKELRMECGPGHSEIAHQQAFPANLLVSDRTWMLTAEQEADVSQQVKA